MSKILAGASEELGLVISVTPHSSEAVAHREGIPFRLRTYAMDQPGIVHRITHLLHEHGANIEKLQSSLEPGSYSGTPLFNMQLRMTVPTSVSVKALRGELETLCDALNCDFDLEPG